MLSISQISSHLGISQKPLPKEFYESQLENPILIEDFDQYRGFIESYQTTPLVHERSQPTTIKKSLSSIVEKYLNGISIPQIEKRDDHSLSFRFLDSIFMIVSEEFVMFEKVQKQYLFQQWIQRLSFELLEKERYYQFNYFRNRAMKRENIILSLNQALTAKCDFDIFQSFIQYTTDMLGISLIVLNIQNEDVDWEKSKIFHYKNIYNPLNPVAIILYESGVYLPLLRNDRSSIWSGEEIDHIYQSFGLKSRVQFIREIESIPLPSAAAEVASPRINVTSKMTLERLQEIATERGISIYKTSEKTGKPIKKIKTELLEALQNI